MISDSKVLPTGRLEQTVRNDLVHLIYLTEEHLVSARVRAPSY